MVIHAWSCFSRYAGKLTWSLINYSFFVNFCDCTMSLICSVLLSKVFFFFFNFPVGIIFLFSRSLRLSLLDPDLPVVWQTKLSVRTVQYFPFPLLCLKSVQWKRVTIWYFFLFVCFGLVFFWLVPGNELDYQLVEENCFYFGGREGTWLRKGSGIF